jgi:L-seryl-tRNA(Ser) seleniumtransferase
VPTVEALRAALAVALERRLGPVVNATGVVLHTNLGRAPWSARAVAAAAEAAGYCAVELDPGTGRRGHRGAGAEERLCALTGAEAALVVNNGAAAVLLALSALAAGRAVVVSRGELVEIGGGFRIPDVLAFSGARLVEVGTTNRTHRRDYEAAVAAGDVALVLQVHHSNFRQIGFVARPTLAELAGLGVPLVVDVGSGALAPLADEPTVGEALAAGADLVCFSGDKLFGGPQAGVVVGRERAVAVLRRHPLLRALRPDKVTLAALEATADDWLTGAPPPARRMIDADAAALRAAVEGWRAALPAGVEARVVAVEGEVGGGSVPGRTWPSWALAIRRPAPEPLRAALLAASPPVVARVRDDELLLDARTVVPLGQSDALLASLLAALLALPA